MAAFFYDHAWAGFFVIWGIITTGCFAAVPDNGNSWVDRLFRAAGYAFALLIVGLILQRLGFGGEYSDRFSS
jgi:Na+-transporting NADH:ubiquinone oxidoreductase subunit NqrD